MKILVCDRCGFELSDRDDINQVIEGTEAWQTAAPRAGGRATGYLSVQALHPVPGPDAVLWKSASGRGRRRDRAGVTTRRRKPPAVPLRGRLS